MKKLFLIVVAIAVVASTTNCSNETFEKRSSIIQYEQDSLIRKQAFCELESEIQNLNHQYVLTHGTVTRGWLGRLFKSFFMDAIGGVFGSWGGPVGASVGAASFSVLAWTNEPVWSPNQIVMTEGSSAISNDLVIPLPRGEEELVEIKDDSVGFYHNYMLQQIGSISSVTGLGLNNISVTLLGKIRNKISQREYNVLYEDFMRPNKVFDKVQANLSSVNSAQSLSELSTTFGNIFPGQREEFNIIKNYIEGIQQIDENASNTYTQNVIELIDGSGISEVEKKNLYRGIVIGQASSRLWKIEPVE